MYFYLFKTFQFCDLEVILCLNIEQMANLEIALH